MGSRPRQGDEHPAYAFLWSMARLPYKVSRKIPKTMLMTLCEAVTGLAVLKWSCMKV